MSKKSKTKKTTKPSQKKRSKGEAASNLKKARAAAKAKPADEQPRAGGVRPGSKLEIVVGLLTRPEGCTTADVLAATGWPTVSLNQQSAAARLSLRKVKEGRVTRYFGTPLSASNPG